MAAPPQPPVSADLSTRTAELAERQRLELEAVHKRHARELAALRAEGCPKPLSEPDLGGRDGVAKPTRGQSSEEVRETRDT